MVQGYYTLQEAAQFLGVSVDELKQLAQKGKIRSFQDRGTLRFRIQDIQELARVRGITSDPELPLGDASLAAAKASSPSSAARKLPKSSGSPSSAARKQAQGPKPAAKKDLPDVFAFEFDADENVGLGEDFLGPKSKSGSKGSKKSPTTPAPLPGSDSDVRLVSDGSELTFSVGRESDINATDSSINIPDPHKPKSGAQPSSTSRKSSQVSLGSGVLQPKAGLLVSSASKPPSPKPGGGPQPADSGVRLVPLDIDSDVKIVGASDEAPIGVLDPAGHTDSNVRLDRVQLPPADSGEGNMLMTEEINLDEELRKHEERSQHKPAKMKAKSELKFPSSSPFELSDSEMKMPEELLDAGPKTPSLTESNPADSSDFEMTAHGPQDGSSDFDLSPGGASPVEDSADFSLEASDEQALADEPAGLTQSSSGISLNNPVDAGISLEEGAGGRSDQDVDFDLSLEAEDTPKPSLSGALDESDGDFQLKVGDTPRPVESSPAESSSEFELSLDSDAGIPATEGQDSDDLDLSLNVDDQAEGEKQDDDSEFEINLDGSDEVAAAKSPADSDSEFELTLDDSGSLAAEGDATAPQVKSKKKGGSDDEQDIFETDFEVPALDESDEATIADSELESSDFDLALDDSELANEEESGSQVVALDEEEDAETLVDSDDAAVVDDIEVEEESSDFGDLDQDVDADAEVEVDADEDEETEGSGKRQTVVKEKLREPAPWGVLPVVFMLPCVLIMFLVGILGYEMMQSTVSMRPPGPLTVALADMLGEKLSNPANKK